LEALDAAGFVVELLACRLRRLARLHGRDVALGGAHVPPAVTVVVGVGSRTETAVVALLPVEDVVAALMSGDGPIADLVVREPGRGQQIVSQLVLVREIVIVGMASGILGEWGS